MIETTGVIVDAATGISGGGRDKFPFCNVDEDFSAYGLLRHRHTPEMEQELGVELLFTPHLAPMSRGILATCYARPAGPTSTAALLDVLHASYDDEPFVVVTDDPPSTKATTGANTCHVTARFDERTGWVLVIAAIDNLVKGTSGQALQCINLAFGLDEALGLPKVGLNP
jgi:N-acetyl-gamma-glutamyl-phosphate reductase